ncbi:hypothetical protein ENSA5_42740 [Enhygromyxa salina]|uniref:Uncharacterized protein n=1 Tax=Enhygromyxa salina TaxID=215803 RepID=A0A2S9XKI6_9BACT|nr:hypothetical protein [Enhygromyxa salina]PRP93375.1 hypothetical protein ENSA5_42740 [Enhygromyxa salina]
MALCIMKDTVERLRKRAMDARREATDDQRADLDDLISECDRALTHATRMPSYPGGRLETGRAQVAFSRAEGLRAKHPGLLPLDDGKS